MKRTLLFLCLLLCTVTYAQNKVKVACVGNSVTYGAGIENREINAYPAQLQRMLGDGYEVMNFGKSGATLLNKGHRPYPRTGRVQSGTRLCRRPGRYPFRTERYRSAQLAQLQG